MPQGFQIYCVINRHGDKGRKVNMALRCPLNIQDAVKNITKKPTNESHKATRGSHIHK